MGDISSNSGGSDRESAASDTADYELADVYAKLRGQVLALRSADVGLPAGQPFGVLMETAQERAVVTLLVIADGTTSLYFSNGGGLIGAGQHESVREAASDFLADVADAADRLEPTTACPLPARGRVRFYLLSDDGIRTAEASEEDLGYQRHELSPLFHAGHAVIAEVYEHTPDDK